MNSGKVIVIGNQKGGAGKTTLAITLATGLKASGLNICLIDADPQESIIKWRMRAEGLAHEEALPDTEKNDTPLLGNTLKRAKERYDAIIVDTGSNLGFAGDNTQKVLLSALREADYVLIPVGPSPLDVDASADFVQLLRDIWERRGEEKPSAYFVVNGVRKNTQLGKETKDILREAFALPVLESEVQFREAYKTSLIGGGTIFTPRKDKDVIENAMAFVDEMKKVVGL